MQKSKGGLGGLGAGVRGLGSGGQGFAAGHGGIVVLSARGGQPTKKHERTQDKG
jgi:hypothetical protein